MPNRKYRLSYLPIFYEDLDEKVTYAGIPQEEGIHHSKLLCVCRALCKRREGGFTQRLQ